MMEWMVEDKKRRVQSTHTLDFCRFFPFLRLKYNSIQLITCQVGIKSSGGRHNYNRNQIKLSKLKLDIAHLIYPYRMLHVIEPND